MKVINGFMCVLMVGVTACGGGDGVGLDENGNSIDNNTPSAPLTATLASIQENILTPSCGVSGCHVAGTAAFGLRLDTEALSAQLLINVSSFEVPSLLRVKPSDPDNSFLFQKIAGTATAGGRMPLNRTPLSSEQIEAVREWIANGALTSSSLSSASAADKNQFDTIQDEILTPHCIACHSGTAPPAELNLEAANSYNNLVNTSRFPSDPAYPVRVIPGDADNSFLIRKLEGHLSTDEGVRMPLNQEPLTVTQINSLREWIDGGALSTPGVNQSKEVHDGK